MFNLIKNEYAKIALKKSTIISIVLCMLLVIAYDVILKMSMNDNVYYENMMSLSEELMYMGNDTGDIYNQAEVEKIQKLIDMGCETWSDISTDWRYKAIVKIYDENYVYAMSDDENIEDIKERDKETENTYFKAIVEAIESDDYNKYYKKLAEYEKYKLDAGISKDDETYKMYLKVYEEEMSADEGERIVKLFSRYKGWKNTYDEYEEQKQSGEYISETDYRISMEYTNIYKYIFDNDIEYAYVLADVEDGYNDETIPFAAMMSEAGVVAAIASILVIIIAAGIFSSEYHSGTIKFLLINPVKRSKIFWSKYLSCISLFLIVSAVFFAVHFLAAVVISGFEGISTVTISYADGGIVTGSVIVYGLKLFILGFIPGISCITLAFMISTLAGNTAIAIAFSFLIQFMGSIISQMLSELGQHWGRYLIFSNFEIGEISKGKGMYLAQSVEESVIILVIYMIVFLLTAYDSFTKKDI